MKTTFFNPVLILAMALISLNIGAQTSNLESTQLVPIHFNSDKAKPLSGLQRILNELTPFTDSPENYRIMITGHTDADGGDDYNLMLSQNRAQSVYNYLVKNGIDKEKIKSQGKGETNPVASNDESKGRSENRRVEIYVEMLETAAVINQKTQVETGKKIDFFGFLYNESDSLLWSNTNYNPKASKQKLPKDAVKPIKGCRAFFSGLLMADEYKSIWTSKIWEPDGYSEYVGAGSYNNLNEAFPKAILSTFDGIAIDSNTRIVIYDQPNFKGKVVLDVTGPLIINNSLHRTSLPKLNTQAYKVEAMNKLFPPEKRVWSNSNMYAWQHGSIRIMPAADLVD